MGHILMAIGSETQQTTIRNTLASQHRITVFDPSHLDKRTFDLCIVDSALWNQLDTRLSSHHQRDVPRLLLMSPEATGLQQPEIEADEVIITPLRINELRLRVAALLKMRTLARQRDELQEKVTIINKAIESTSDSINIANVNGTSVYANPAFIEKFQYSINELNLGGIPNVLFAESGVGKQVFEKVRQRGTWRGEARLKARDGRIIPTLLFVDSITDDRDRPIGFISVCTDITTQKLVERIEREQRFLAEALQDTAATLTSTLDFDEVISRILDNISNVVPHDAANIILIDNGLTRLVRSQGYAFNHPLQQLETTPLPIENLNDLHSILMTGRPMFIPNTKQYAGNHANHTPWLNSHIGSPIMLQGEVIGFLNVDSNQPNWFQETHAEYLQLFAEQAAIAIHNARLHEKVQLLAAIEERQRLARNLHDAVSQTLFSATLIAEALPRLWEQRSEELPERLEQLHRLTRGALAEMRTLLLELHPERLLRTQIDDLIQQIADTVMGQQKIAIVREIQDVGKLPTPIHIAMYYIAQEAFNNIVKHAEASNVIVKLHRDGAQVDLRIVDDGRGFELQHIEGTGLGLENMRERAESNEITFQIRSKPGSGTEIIVSWSSREEMQNVKSENNSSHGR